MKAAVEQRLENLLALLFRCGRWLCPVIFSIVGLVVVVLLAVLMVGTQAIYRVDFKELEKLSSTVSTGEFSNGLNYMVVFNKYKPGVFSEYLCVECGSAYEDDTEQGIAHFVEHNAFDQTRDYLGRNAVMREIMRVGATFNAFTSFRTTCYQLWDMPKDNFDLAQNILKNQVLYQVPNQTHMDLEKGAVLGEARYRNGSDYVALVDMLNNHGGDAWRIQRRFPIGKPPIITNFSEAQVKEFVAKWYHLDRMRLIVVGDVSVDTAIEKIENAWRSESGNGRSSRSEPDMGSIQPIKSFFLREVPGINGVEMNLLITSPLETHPYNANIVRRHTVNMLFMLTYQLQIEAMLQYNYDWQRDIHYGGRTAGVAIEIDYSLATTLRAFSVTSPGNAQTGTWKADWAMALTELRRLALNGPPAALVVGMMYVVSNMLESDKRMSGHMDSTSIIEAILGDNDPNFIYQDAAQAGSAQQRFLGLGFVTAAQLQIQAEAQLMWNALVQIATGEVVFEGLTSFPSSLNVFHDAGYPAGAKITQDAVLGVIRQVHNANPPDSMEKVLSGMIDLSPTEGIPRSGYLIQLQGSATMPEKVANHPGSGVEQYKLANGVMVNFKNSSSVPGELLLQVVSLGGKTTQTPRLAGACELVNLPIKAGNSAVYNEETVDYTEDTVSRYMNSHGSGASLKCGLEEFTISAKLGGDYYRSLEAVRLIMNPIYDDTSIERAVNILEDRDGTLARTEEPMNLITEKLDPKLLQHIFPNDKRFELVTPDTIGVLNPYLVQIWVREQFRPDRIEINIVGHATQSMLKQLNRVLGSIPDPAIEMVGYDIYGNDSTSFFLKQPATPYNLSCTIPSVAADRGYAVAYGAAPDFYQLVNDTTRGLGQLLAAKAAASLWSMWNVRVLKGYGYFAMTSSFHSLLFPNLGYYRVEWEPGGYPTPLGNDPLNLRRSIEDVAMNVFSLQIPIDIVQDSLNQLIEQTKTRYSINSYWIDAIKGIALRPPTWVTGLGSGFIKPLNATDVLGELNKVNITLLGASLEGGLLFSASLATIPILSSNSKPILDCTENVN